MENEADIIREKYPLVLESVPEVQKSHPTVEMPVIFVKPEITDRLNNFLKTIGLKEPDLMPSKTIVIDVDSSMQTNTKNSISMPNNNIIEASDINNSPMTLSSEDLVYDKGLMKTTSLKIFPIENIDKIITFNNKESLFEQFLEKLQNIVINDLKKFENNNDFTENDDRLMLNNQKDRALDTFNEIESLGLEVMILNREDSVDSKISSLVENNVQDPEQMRVFDIIEDAAQDDPSEKSSSRDGTDGQIDGSLQLDFVICPPYQSYESSGMSSEQSIQSSLTSQSVPTPEFLKQIKNIVSNDYIKNKNKRDADNSNMLMSASSDVSASESDENFDTWMPIHANVQNTKDYHSSKISANTKQEEEIYKLIKDVESYPSKNSNYFQWWTAPPTFANNLQIGSKYISASNKIQENMETIDAVIPEKNNLHNQSQVEIKTNSFIYPKIQSEIRKTELNNANILENELNILENKLNMNMDDYTFNMADDENLQLPDKLFNENFDNKIEDIPIEIPIEIPKIEIRI